MRKRKEEIYLGFYSETPLSKFKLKGFNRPVLKHGPRSSTFLRGFENTHTKLKIHSESNFIEGHFEIQISPLTDQKISFESSKSKTVETRKTVNYE